MFDPTKPVQTRAGRAARIVCTDRKLSSSEFPIVALVMDEDGEEDTQHYTSTGSYWSGPEPTDEDLINIPATAERFFSMTELPEDGYGAKIGVAVRHASHATTNGCGWGDKLLKVTYLDGKPVAAEIV